MTAGVIGTLTATLLVAVAQPSAAGTSAPVELARGGANESVSFDVNSSDVSVGAVESNGWQAPARWDRRGRLTVLPSLEGFPGAQATAINDAGLTVGYAYGPDYAVRPLTWDRDGNRTELTVPGYANAEAEAVNERGVVMGEVFTSGRRFRSVRWDNGRAALLPPLPGHTNTSGVSLLDDGTIIGSSSTDSPGETTVVPVRWNRSGAATPLPVPDGATRVTVYSASATAAFGYVFNPNADGYFVRWDLAHGNALTRLAPLEEGALLVPQAVNDRGVIAGYSYKDGVPTAVTWDRVGVPTRLPALPGASTAADINDSGESVGSANGHSVAVWSARGKITPLEPVPGAGSTYPREINERGSVLGFAMVQNGSGYANRAFLWPAHR
ncbi:hypothetical protein V5P93_003466 [Actinokineospora auranticolor]|uniref:hypothetical protein n=1 Tax=Actinokineospora auranticolor TaxID=155976 RepID=UPI0011B0DE27|nr:hypothetical protein [Actinokineospora auranticolor]